MASGVLAALVLAGCSDDAEPDAPSAPSESSYSETAPRGQGSPTSPGPTSEPDDEPDAAPEQPTAEPPEPNSFAAMPVAPRYRVEATDRTEEQFELEGADWLAEAAGAVWVKRDDGGVDRIDPWSNQVTGSFTVHEPGQECSGLGGDGDILWVCTPDGIASVDVWNVGLGFEVEIDKIFEQGTLPVAYEHVWVLTGDGSTLSGVGLWSGAVAFEHDLAEQCAGLAAGHDALWAACPEAGVVLKLDPWTGEELGRVTELPGVTMLTVDDAVYAGYDGGTVRIEAASAEPTGAVNVGPGSSTGGLAASGGVVWIRTEGTFLRQLDGRSLDLVEEVTADVGGGSVLLAFDSVWASSYSDGVVYRLTPTRFPGLQRNAADGSTDQPTGEG